MPVNQSFLYVNISITPLFSHIKIVSLCLTHQTFNKTWCRANVLFFFASLMSAAVPKMY